METSFNFCKHIGRWNSGDLPAIQFCGSTTDLLVPCCGGTWIAIFDAREQQLREPSAVDGRQSEQLIGERFSVAIDHGTILIQGSFQSICQPVRRHQCIGITP